ncbi:hypothetical protein [Mycobacterium sp.]|uniref:hypothetical protein n=1 Tax=Mycobacterium sp. TaxID=1785 RepID=UPI00333FC1A8
MMERRVGVILLLRTTREVQLTPAGAVFLDHCLDWSLPPRPPTSLPNVQPTANPGSSVLVQ